MVKREARPRGTDRGSDSRAGQEIGDFASRVLDVAESIPPGRVMSYGDIAEYIGQGGPRQVGRVMALWGGGVPWWRVVHRSGTLAAPDTRRQRRALEAEGVEVTNGRVIGGVP